ncbi:hypothetical protein DPMN_186678 [Dreissena polymorpha]|uniref:Uncharacterized protein n=1 Tax=Dreissena polymorpha TaxID=45954 RepID=A0A9D4DN12_DREPO|nr:hypothetical protein DPMN_186678 [Dreissena polymorpha]
MFLEKSSSVVKIRKSCENTIAERLAFNRPYFQTFYLRPLTQELLKYMSTIRTAARMHAGLGWKAYDQQFCFHLAVDPAGTRFDKIDYELWLLYVCSLLGVHIAEEKSVGPCTIKVWILGLSIVKQAFVAARQRPEGVNLGFNRRRHYVAGMGWMKMSLLDVASKLKALKKVAETPDFIILHCGGFHRVIWDFITGRTLSMAEGEYCATICPMSDWLSGKSEEDANPEVTAILPKAEAVTGMRNGDLVIWGLRNAQPSQQLLGSGSAHRVTCVALSEDGRYLVFGFADGTLKVWDMHTERPVQTLQGHTD